MDYATRLECLNNFPDNKGTSEPIDSSQLSYATLGEYGNQVSKTADSSSTMKQQCVFNEDLALNKATNSNENMFNV